MTREIDPETGAAECDCGQLPRIIGITGKACYVWCRNCWNVEGPTRATQDEAVAAWNRGERTPGSGKPRKWGSL